MEHSPEIGARLGLVAWNFTIEYNIQVQKQLHSNIRFLHLLPSLLKVRAYLIFHQKKKICGCTSFSPRKTPHYSPCSHTSQCIGTRLSVGHSHATSLTASPKIVSRPRRARQETVGQTKYIQGRRPPKSYWQTTVIRCFTCMLKRRGMNMRLPCYNTSWRALEGEWMIWSAAWVPGAIARMSSNPRHSWYLRFGNAGRADR